MQLVHLVRHGRTAWNVERRVMGWLDEGVEPGWRTAAERVADALAAEPVPVVDVCTSPLRRARETAAPLAHRVGREARVEARAGELHVGPWEGLLETEVASRWPDEWHRWRTEPHTLTVAGRETLAACNTRVGELLDDLTGAASDAEGAVAVFTHDVVVRAAVAWALGTGPEIYRHVEVANCSITTVRMVDGVRRLVRANDVGHLQRHGGQR